MYQGKGLWLCIIATLMLTTVAIAQDTDRNPDEQQLDKNRSTPAVQSGAMIFVRQTIIPLLDRSQS